MPAASITVGNGRYRKELGSIDDLVNSIKAVGLIHPIVVDPDGNLIAGERRLAACLRLDWKDIPVTIVDVDADRLKIEMDENTVRADFTPTEAVAIAGAIKDREQANAKERMVAAHASPANFAGQQAGRTRDKVAAVTGKSHETIRKATAVMDAAAADPALEHVVEEMDRTGKVDPAYRKVRRPKREPLTDAQLAAFDRRRRRQCADELSRLVSRYQDLKRWQPVWDAYRKVENVDREDAE